MFMLRQDPEKPKPLAHIWRQLHCLFKLRPIGDPNGWSSKDEWLIDVGYCLDRYSLIDAPPRRNE